MKVSRIIKFLQTNLAILMVLLFSHGVCAETKLVRFATEATYPPFEYIDASGEIKGFDIDIAKALCKQMNVECSFNNQSFNSLIPSLELGKYDAIIASLGITPERQKQVNFTHSYYQPSAIFVGPVNKDYSIKELHNVVVGVQQGSTFENYLNDRFGKKITIKAYIGIQDAFLDLISGRVDMVIADTSIATDWLKQQTDKKFVMLDKPIVDEKYFGSGYGIAVNKNNPKLLKSLNLALAEIKKNGIYARIVQKYFTVN